MTPREYTLGKRVASVEATKQRIMRATFELHNRQGPAATTLPQVAREADVALGTVYRYFPTVEDLVAACGQHVRSLLDPPSPEIFMGVPDFEDRVGLLVKSMFEMYARGELQISETRCQQRQVGALAVFVEESKRHHKTLVREALRPLRPTPRAIREAVALTDFYVWKAFADAGVATNAAIHIVASALLARLHGALARKGTQR